MTARTNPAGYLRGLVVAILALPSLWMLATVSPLWRDMDAYVQVTYGPGSGTLLQYSALYCFPARVPLYLGYCWNCLKNHDALPGWAFFEAPVLSDQGVFYLLLSQHALLAVAQVFLLRSISSKVWIQISLAILLAANACFYTFTHTVGTESLSLSCLLLLAGISLRIFRKRRVSWSHWLCYSLILTLCIAVRHINGVLPAILPGACLLSLIHLAILAWGRRRLGKSHRLLSIHGGRLRVAVACGVISLFLATLIERGLCAAFDVKYQSIAGYAFSWRLNFLTAMTEAEREKLLSDLKATMHDAFSEKMLAAIPAGLAPDGHWDLDAYEQCLRELAAEALPSNREAKARLMKFRNELASAIIRSQNAAYLEIVCRDFHYGWQISPAHVAVTPWLTTAYYFSHQDRMPKLATLRSFEGADAQAKLTRGAEVGYYRLCRFSYLSALAVWLALAVLGWGLSGEVHTLAFSVSLIAVGSLLFLVNMALTEYEDRYTLPLWALLCVAILLHAAQCLEWGRFKRRKGLRAAFMD